MSLLQVLSRTAGRSAAVSSSVSSARLLGTTSSNRKEVQVDKVTPSAVRVYTKDELRSFMAVFPDLVRDLTFMDCYHDVPSVNKHLSKMVQYNVPNGKKNRGMSVPVAYKMMLSSASAPPTEEQMRLAHVLGWCVEFVEAAFLVSDNILDGIEHRRDSPSWHTREDVGLSALNDSILLESCTYTLLNKYFADKPYYADLVDDFHTASRHTAMGKSLELLTNKLRTAEGKVDVDQFTMKRFNEICKFKMSYATFYLPVAAGMRMAGVTRPDTFHTAQSIFLGIGKFLQVEDDFLGCFGDPKITGKKGNDIAQGKCCWLIAVAMQRANKEQKQILRDNYGVNDEASVQRVKDVYKDLKLPKLFKAYEEESYRDIVEMIRRIPGEGKLLPPALFTFFLDRIYSKATNSPPRAVKKKKEKCSNRIM